MSAPLDKASVTEASVHDLREFAGPGGGGYAQPSAVILDRRTLQSSPESGVRAGCDDYNLGRVLKLMA